MTKLLDILRNHFSQVRQLKIPRSVKFGKTGIRGLAEACPYITDIDLCDARVNGKELQTLAFHLPHLSGIRLGLPRRIEGRRGFNNDWFISFVQTGSRLRKISLAGGFLSFFDLRCLTDQELRVIADCCPMLESFEYMTNILCFRDSTGWINTGDPGILHMIRTCLKLERLKLGVLSDIANLRQISQMPHHLTSFEVDYVSASRVGFWRDDDGEKDALLQLINQRIEANRASRPNSQY